MPKSANLTRIRVIKNIKMAESEALAELLDSAAEAKPELEDRIRDLRWCDIIASARHDGSPEPGYAVIEISITLNENDAERAVRRAQALAEAADAPVRPLIIGAAIAPETRRQAEQNGVTVIIYDP